MNLKYSLSLALLAMLLGFAVWIVYPKRSATNIDAQYPGVHTGPVHAEKAGSNNSHQVRIGEDRRIDAGNPLLDLEGSENADPSDIEKPERFELRIYTEEDLGAAVTFSLRPIKDVPNEPIERRVVDFSTDAAFAGVQRRFHAVLQFDHLDRGKYVIVSEQLQYWGEFEVLRGGGHVELHMPNPERRICRPRGETGFYGPKDVQLWFRAKTSQTGGVSTGTPAVFIDSASGWEVESRVWPVEVRVFKAAWTSNWRSFGGAGSASLGMLDFSVNGFFSVTQFNGTADVGWNRRGLPEVFVSGGPEHESEYLFWPQSGGVLFGVNSGVGTHYEVGSLIDGERVRAVTFSTIEEALEQPVRVQ